jgi:hypothetical protein
MRTSSVEKGYKVFKKENQIKFEYVSRSLAASSGDRHDQSKSKQ